jgi:hypothetical protein
MKILFMGVGHLYCTATSHTLEHIMTTASNLTFSNHNETSYFANVGRAARGLIVALLAHKPRPVAVVAQRNKQQDLRTLFEMASSQESLSPNLAAELRFMASRG